MGCKAVLPDEENYLPRYVFVAMMGFRETPCHQWNSVKRVAMRLPVLQGCCLYCCASVLIMDPDGELTTNLCVKERIYCSRVFKVSSF